MFYDKYDKLAKQCLKIRVSLVGTSVKYQDLQRQIIDAWV